MALNDDLQWRYATKKYDVTKKVAQEDIAKIVEAARMAPSSYGLQPYRVLIISNQDLKKSILPIAWNQQIVEDCSHLLIFAAWDNYDRERIEKIFDYTTDNRGVDRGTAFGSHTEAIIDSQVNMSANDSFLDAAKQACIAFGFAIAQAAELKVDATPMGGFNNNDLDELLRLGEKGLKSVYMLALGYRASEGDWLQNLNKVRTNSSEFFIEFK